MSLTLGHKIGEGATADVYAWTPGQVVKLFKAGVPRSVIAHEAQMTRAVFAAGGLAPEVVCEIAVDGRVGLVMTRLHGLSLMQAAKAKALSFQDAGAVLAACLQAVHTPPPPRHVPPLRVVVSKSMQGAGATLPNAVASGLAALLDRLPSDGVLCHGDPNPGNVIMTDDGPKLIDWIAAVRAPAAFDLANAQVMLTELAPFVADDPERPRAINAALQAAYATRVNLSPDALAKAVEPYLPIVRTIALLSGALPAFAPTLLRSLQADFPR